MRRHEEAMGFVAPPGRLAMTPARATTAATFDEVARANLEAVRRYLARRTGSLGVGSGDADDLLVEVLQTTWRRFEEVPEGAELPWMLGVAKRVLANARRRSDSAKRMIDKLHAPLGDPSAEAVAVAELSVREALASLSATEREILELSAFEGLGPAQCAEVLGISTNAASIRLHRAKQSLRNYLEAAKEADGERHHVDVRQPRQGVNDAEG